MEENTDIIQAVDVSISVLMAVAKSPDTRLTDIARKLNQTKPRILRMLRTLEHRGLVRKTSEGGYRLGNAIIVLGTAASTQVDLVKIASPILESVGQKVNETVQLRIIDNAESLCIAKFEPSRDLRVHALIGRRRPLYAGSSKVLLAFLPQQLQLLPARLDRFTQRTITDRIKLMAHLREIRKAGYCISRGEVSDQLVSVAVPVLAFDGSVIAALNIAAPAFRTQDSDLERFVSILKGASRKISEELNW
ncbi:IclR family transcriptional regulator [Microvirga sp. G4-2]|uniref:IclR family transcriptional regulator n=1 Tax=Microvirga sp. G4-2 TaxID=3434467 RepID=UPI004044926F